ncbi:alpha/beta fold hydrolase [Prauserella cavernicola]|uniref:Alpha/beta fold hydrolase n=1 Tax=Prauserella cavernicola TaxID=2800127 RepID=A0A934QQI2_9PSEU|nr:alpha/beta fold hydrolase [Prauserella cavernicola]MBK1784881.1 alpha/beta fold hydrolase [Prauserella cavernicola]
MKRKLAMLCAAATTAGAALVGAPVAASAEPAGSDLAWQRCSPDEPENFQCATVTVPLDYADPDGRTIDVTISRLKAAESAKRKGVLLMNPGGPGASGLTLPLTTGSRLPQEVKDSYDLIGFDPRGIGRSTPISCGLEHGWSPMPFDPETFDQTVADTKEMANACLSKQPDLLPFITTRNTARDLDAIRTALGERTISYFGISYGTYLGAVFTEMFPDSVDKVVLDSSVDPERVWRGMVQIWALGAERGFQVFAEWAAERDAEYHLGESADDVSALFRDLLTRLDREPVRLDGETVDGNVLRSEALSAGPTDDVNADYAEFLGRVRAAADGEPAARTGAALKQAPAVPNRWQDEVPPDNSDSAFLAVVCGDAVWPRDVERYRRDAIQDGRRYPILGAVTSNIAPCAFWPEPREPATEVGEVDSEVLLVQNSHDSQTPIEGAANLRELLGDNARMALVDGSWEHGAYPGNCADSVVTRYLMGDGLPEQDTTCQTAKPPVGGSGS